MLKQNDRDNACGRVQHDSPLFLPAYLFAKNFNFRQRKALNFEKNAPHGCGVKAKREFSAENSRANPKI